MCTVLMYAYVHVCYDAHCLLHVVYCIAQCTAVPVMCICLHTLSIGIFVFPFFPPYFNFYLFFFFPFIALGKGIVTRLCTYYRDRFFFFFFFFSFSFLFLPFISDHRLYYGWRVFLLVATCASDTSHF